MADVKMKINPRKDHPELFLAAEIAIEVLGSDGPIGTALNGYMRNLQRSTWRTALQRAQHVIRYAGLPDTQTKALIEEIESYMDKEVG